VHRSVGVKFVHVNELSRREPGDKDESVREEECLDVYHCVIFADEKVEEEGAPFREATLY